LLLSACGGSGGGSNTNNAPVVELSMKSNRTVLIAGGNKANLRVSASDGSNNFSWQLAANNVGSLSAGSGSSVTYQSLSAATIQAPASVTIIVNCGKYSKSLDLKIYPDPGVVGISLLAGAPGGPGDDDGLGSQARFNGIRYFTIDAHGNLYVTSSDPDKFGTQAIRKVTPDGMVTTLTSRFSGGTDGARGVAKIANPRQIAVDSHGTLYFIDDYG
jgi:hypothetical protein